ncbi:MAG: extracellular solute-binding protein [Candidatus Eremiobacteraeota bacterium]|nr:extracellular solute-binding protein [Candidatus Eremiobacteraeota bacterium]
MRWFHAFAALAVLGLFGAATPRAHSSLEDKAKAEGTVNWYTSVDLALAERVAHEFQVEFPGVTVQVTRSGSERNFQRIEQEYQSRIHNVDVVNSSDASHFIVWGRQGYLAKYLPDDVTKYYPASARDRAGRYATWRTTLMPIAYNTKLVKTDEAPKSYADLLQPRWEGKLVKSHPGYSGSTMTATYEIVQNPALGWKYLEALAKQKVVQVQSASEPPKVLADGEQPVQVDGSEYVLFQRMQDARPIAIVYPTEGTPAVESPAAVMAFAPHPNAARLFMDYLFAIDCQQLLVNVGGLRSLRRGIIEPSWHTPLSKIKLMRENPAAIVTEADAIKARYTQLFGT